MKTKILTLSDHPLSPSGVAHQTKAMIKGLLDKHPGKYQFFCLGGAIKHKDYSQTIVDQDKYDKDWIIQPVDGYGSPEILRSVMRTYRPDVVWFMTDPRFYGWLWNMDNEIRVHAPMVYYHVWDNYPYPEFNKKWYTSNDMIATISKVTSDIVKTVAPDVEEKYIPHAVDPTIFKPLEEKDIKPFKERLIEAFPQNDGKFMFFWNNRNARRKQSGSLIFWFKDFLDKVGHDKAFLIMHTEPRDPHGQPLDHLIEKLGLDNGQVIISQKKVAPSDMAGMYNMADCTINIADAEGFGLSSLESLSCGTPVINTMTGGLQEQVTDGENWFGIGIEPSSKAVIGSLEVPYIYEDRISGDDVVSAFEKMLTMSDKERQKMIDGGLKHVAENYSFDKYVDGWNDTLDEVVKQNGSWSNRKNYKSWKSVEVL
mgnify:CR=1 FL=1